MCSCVCERLFFSFEKGIQNESKPLDTDLMESRVLSKEQSSRVVIHSVGTPSGVPVIIFTCSSYSKRSHSHSQYSMDMNASLSFSVLSGSLDRLRKRTRRSN